MSRATPPPDTIVAIATPPGRGGIGVIRISGADLEPFVAGLVGRPLDARVATHTAFHDTHGDRLDIGLALYFPAPRSYTGESVLELHGHGSPAAQRLVLARCLELGARLAEPGEFTRRAFENGRIDLAQAESVADLIEASSSAAARAAARSLAGDFSREVRAIVTVVTELRMLVEASLDFPEEDVALVRASDAASTLAQARAWVERLTSRALTGTRLARGLSVVLVGRPNVGKSSLMNRLARDEVAIVAPIPGTTRDTVVRELEVGGYPLTVVDTAGLRETEDPVERLGIGRTMRAIAEADAAVVLVDAAGSGAELAEADRAVLAKLPAGLARIVVHNKADLVGRSGERGVGPDGVPHVWLSALTGEGMAGLEAELLAVAGVDAAGEDAFIARVRHLEALREAGRRLDAAAAQLGRPRPALELYAEELREAQSALAAITGEFSADDLLGEIFSRFCIGK